jgi:GTP-binding protein
VINAVLKRKSIARVSHTPGKTQAVHFYLINKRFYLVDLPGYGYAKVSQTVRRSWAALVQGYLDSSTDLRVIFLLLDSRRIPSGDDLRMHEWTLQSGADERILLTKTDKLSNNELSRSLSSIATELDVDQTSLIACSAVTKKGIEDVRREIASRL